MMEPLAGRSLQLVTRPLGDCDRKLWGPERLLFSQFGIVGHSVQGLESCHAGEKPVRTCNDFSDVFDGDLVGCSSEALWGQGRWWILPSRLGTLLVDSEALGLCGGAALVSGCEGRLPQFMEKGLARPLRPSVGRFGGIGGSFNIMQFKGTHSTPFTSGELKCQTLCFEPVCFYSCAIFTCYCRSEVVWPVTLIQALVAQ